MKSSVVGTVLLVIAVLTLFATLAEAHKVRVASYYLMLGCALTLLCVIGTWLLVR